MKNLKKSHWILIISSVLILIGCIGATAYLLFSNYQNVRLFKQAQSNFLRGDEASLSLAETQLLQLIRHDSDNEAAYIMLGAIAEKRKIYPEQVYYCFMAHRLNPLSQINKERYIKSLWYARYFDRLETFLSQQPDLTDEQSQMLLYSASRNGNFNKYKHQLERWGSGNPIGELAFLLFKHNHLSAAQKLAALDKIAENDLVRQELCVARAELNLAIGDIDQTQKALEEAYELNNYAFTQALGSFYANYRSLGQALKVYEKYIATYHDPVIALKISELYALLKRPEKIAELRNQYQSDSGSNAMLLCYYLDALVAFNNNDFASLKEHLEPWRKNIKTPLALFMFFCVDMQEKNLSAILENYTELTNGDTYKELQDQADNLLLFFLKNNFKEFSGKEAQLLPLANLLYQRKPDAFTAKLILLTQKRTSSLNIVLLQDALKKFGSDHGIVKLGIEYYLNNDLAEAARLINLYKRNFAGKTGDMLRYEIVLAARKHDFDQVSKLFKNNFLPELRSEYWNFASSTMRKDDLLFLSKDKVYAPYCQAQLLLLQGKKAAACDLLEKSDAQGNWHLLIFAARTLGENNRHQAALNLYNQIPANTPYQLDVLLNKAELFAECGNIAQALELSRQAYDLAPELPEAQLCYADKLSRSGNAIKIPDVIKLKSANPLRKRMEILWIAGMQQRIKESFAQNQQEKTRELCRKLLSVAPNDSTALEYLKTLNKKQ